jgi:carboxylesterase
MSLLEAATEVGPDLQKITQPVLVMTSPEDHVVPPTDSDFIAENVSGPVERVFLERSYHVATQDYDKQLIFDRSAQFVDAVTQDLRV